MAHTITVLGQAKIANLGLVTVGTLNPSGSYATGGEDASTSIQAKLQGYTTISYLQFGYDDLNTAEWDKTLEKVRISKKASGVQTELANAAAYDSNIAIPFLCISR